MTSYVVIFVVSLLLINAYMYFQQPRMIFYPYHELFQTPADWGLEYEDVTLETKDGVQLHGWYIPHSQSQHVLLFFHGNAGNISHRRDSIEIFHRLGLNVFIIDYRGYGKSKDKPSESGLYQDARTAWDFITAEKGYTSQQIIIFGRSLGGVIAANLASEVQARGLILESSFSSARDFARVVFPILARLVWIRYDFNTVASIQHVNAPLLVLHSPEDEIMPFHLGERVFEAANEPKHFVRLRGDHNYGFIKSQPEYEQALKSWLQGL
jgi:fermentation-respiration switch protein FrsA (DUF1100 family)